MEGLNWYKGIAPNGQPIRDPMKEPQVAGALTSPNSSGATGWPNPAYNPGHRTVLRGHHAVVHDLL